ncbi:MULTISPECIES: MFS transporter [Kitasatospora]|uniref:Putative major facilitator superfamily transporter n=1 Tax=Kitasatospora setae (strain ATCC 33774 / DSM 43861 / JCM 3304 / KCC A-0304 / NBRC 14216 / KM-6054) TaxID=452652 RepID=E4NBX9_KITSK|nr:MULTISPECIES: MFS transporter [Kitasatospora]BAJ28710.1 putative major facilitator superfamily transporter [Kitasatospora setae KM-6054]
MTTTAAGPERREDAPAASAFGVRAFRQVFAASAASTLGTQISYLAVPLLAVTVLDASPGQVSALAALGTAAFLLIGLPAGAWTDRMRKRRLQITADLVRALLFGSVPVAWALDALTIGQLYAVVLLSGLATVFFDVANQSFLPHVVGRELLGEANAKLVGMQAVNQVAGRSAGGYLVQLLGAPLAVALNAVTYLWSALCLLRVRASEPKPERRPDTHLGREILEGTRFVLGHPMLRPLALDGALTNMALQMIVTVLPVLFVRELGLSEFAFGTFLAMAGLGVFLGSLAARRLGRRLGAGRSMWLVGLCVAPAGFVLPLLDRGPMLWAAGAAYLLMTFKVGTDNVVKVTFRQQATPAHLLGRMNATFRFLLTGSLAIGSVLSGVLAETVGIRAVLWTGAAVLSLSWTVVFCSPHRRAGAP